MNSIRSFVTLALALAAIALTINASAQSSHPLPRRPNIILIVANGLSAGDLSCYGQTNLQTPNLDRLAAGGVRFSRYSGGVDSLGNIAGLLAGRNSATTPGDANLALLLRQNSYSTALLDEWPFDREPWLRGFDEFAGSFTDAE